MNFTVRLAQRIDMESVLNLITELAVFEKEPQPEMGLLMNSALSLTPHTGAATNEAQDRIGTELATQIIEILK